MNSRPLLEGLDYYLENGRWVFTAHYLAQRGHCCESGCRHCPYGFKTTAVTPDPTIGEEETPPGERA